MKKVGKLFMALAMAISFRGVAQQPLMLNNLVRDTTAPQVINGAMFMRSVPSDNRYRYRSIILPASLIAYGFVALENDGLRHLNSSTKSELREDHPAFITHADNYLQFAPAVAVYALNIAGVKGKHNLRNRSVIYGLTMLMSTAIVFPLKKLHKKSVPIIPISVPFHPGTPHLLSLQQNFYGRNIRMCHPGMEWRDMPSQRQQVHCVCIITNTG